MKHRLTKQLVQLMAMSVAGVVWLGLNQQENVWGQEAPKPLSAEELRALVPKAYDGFDADLKLLRKTTQPPVTNAKEKEVNASSPEACQAAARVFKNVNFVGMTREQILRVLGDPKTVSDYGIEAEKNPDVPLFYRFDSGRGGVEYTLKFKDGKVAQVEANGLN